MSDGRCQLVAQSKVAQEKLMNLLISKRMFIFMSILCSAVFSDAQQQIYLDPSKSIQQRTDDLLERMTLEEKIGQMNMPCCYLRVFGDSRNENFEFDREFAQRSEERRVG